jgi:signal transduction histidine kinase
LGKVAEHTNPVRRPGGRDIRRVPVASLSGLPVGRDVALAAGLGVVAALGPMLVPAVRQAPGPLVYALVMAAAAMLAWRRSARFASLAGAVGAGSAYLLGGSAYGAIEVCVVVALFAVARRASPFSGGLPAARVGGTLARLVRAVDLRVVFMLAWTSWLAVPWAPGVLAPASPAVVEPSNHDLIARAALAERTRIASEVHDVAGHGLATIAMQAGVALLMFEERPEQARESLEAIRATSMRALTELRGALETMHPLENAHLYTAGAKAALGGGGDIVPRAGPADLARLIDNVRAAGLPVDLEPAELGGALPVDVDIVYRVVRESLTNILRHAGPTRAVVRVAYQPGELVVEVADRGRGVPDAARPAGRGLAGMRARVEAAGGVLSAGPREGGGFRVTARLPAGAE